MNIHRHSFCIFAAAVVLSFGGITSAAAKAPRSEMAQAQAACSAHNQKVRGLEAQGLSEEQLKPERDAYERACARLEALRGNLSSPAAEVAAFESASAPAKTSGDCAPKQ